MAIVRGRRPERLLLLVLLALAGGCRLDDDPKKHGCLGDEHCAPGRFCVLGQCQPSPAASPPPPPPDGAPPDASVPPSDVGPADVAGAGAAEGGGVPDASLDAGEDQATPPPDSASDGAPPDSLAPDAPPEEVGPDGCLSGEFKSGDRCVSDVVAVAAARYRTCAVLRDGTVWCWGGSAVLSRPDQVLGLANVRSVSLGGWWGAYGGSACAVTLDERLLCWGASWGQAVDAGTPPPASGQARVVVDAGGQPLVGVKTVALGEGFGCASTATEVHCWGTSSYGQLAVPGGVGNGMLQVPGASPPIYYRPYAALAPGAPAGPVGAGPAVAISAGGGQVCGWGWHSGGHRFWPVVDMPVTTPSCLSIGSIKQIGIGYNGACFLRDNGDVGCWGYDLGVRDAPGGRAAIGPATHMAAGSQSICARQTDGRVFCWGPGREGQLGNGPTTYGIFPPQEVMGLGNGAVAVGSGSSADHFCAILTDGSLQCWGRNAEGQLGNGTSMAASPGPLPVKW